MIAGNVRDEIDLISGESRQIAILDQVIGMFVMLPRIDMVPDIVQDRRELQPLALSLPKSMQRFCLIKQA